MYKKIFVLAHLKLFEGENMRRTPIYSKYRPIFDFKGARTKVSARIDLLDRESLVPGSSTTVQITFLQGMIDDKYFKKDEPFTFTEGNFILGEGKILERLNTSRVDM